ncbi:TIGR02594 family protein, partial [Apibacter muscae]|uniref:TIGR02594 family protein n=1 Tax=Apibacter muscae TaxID=2509004 RepID=UPI0011AB9633
ARSVNEFNLAFTKYGINSCMQKIVFLALGYAETRFKSLGEEISSFNSSKSIYKGRGFHQLTGTRDGNGFYNSPGPYENYATAVGNQNIISHPDLICKNIHYAIDSAGWFWTDPNWGKKVPLWSSSSNVKYIKFRANYFSKALGKPLNEVSHLVEDDEKYFWLQAKLLNGYPKGEKLEIEPNGWKTRKNAFDILKNNVFEFNIRCKGNEQLNFNTEGRAPWMKIAWEEESKKLVETGSNKEIQKFFNGTPYEKSMKDGSTNESISWCGAFVNWVMTKYGYAGLSKNQDQYDTVRALKWAEWSEGKNIGKPVYGAIAVKKRSGGGHVGFVAGKVSDKIVILGGNQGNALKCSKYNITDYFAYMIPNNYPITEIDYNLPEYIGNPSEKESEV